MRAAHRVIVLLLVLLSGSIGSLTSQEKAKQDPLVINLDEIISDNKRDEIQRYFGYEDLIFRYITLPYDLSTNTNQQGRNVDFGFALFMLLPIVFLGVVYKHRKVFYAALILFSLYLCLCLSYSFHITKSHGSVKNHGANWEDYLSNSDQSIVEGITTGVFTISHYVSRPIHALGDMISGNTDHWTYPILILLFIGSLWLLISKIQLSNRGQFIVVIFIPFSFLWLVLSSGIIWYGFLMIPIGLIGILHFVSNGKFSQYFSQSIVKNIVLTFLIIWAVMCWVGRISNINSIQSSTNSVHTGKAIVDNNTLQYSAGFINAKEARSRSYTNINDALEKVNSNDALIYQIGTFFAFDIKNNSQRLFQDNTLTQFLWLVEILKDKETIAEALKESGFKYILVDLYTHTLDKTPERSLTNKYAILLNTLIKNPSLQLLATDRVIEMPQSDGTTARQARVFGENIVNFGSYAIYEIL